MVARARLAIRSNRVAIWTNFSPFLRNLAYAGFFYDFVLAAAGHLMVGDGDAAPAIVAIVLLAVSYWSRAKLAGDAGS